MTTLFTPNDGSRLSLLELGRRATGELEGAVDPVTAEAFDASRAAVAPFDYEILRARAVRIEQDLPRAPAERPEAPGPRSWWMVLVPLAAAALALVMVQIPTERLKGDGPSARIEFLVLQDGMVKEGGPATRVRAGDQIQFTATAHGFETLVLLGIDGTGRTAVYWPEHGTEALAIDPDETVLLDGSLRLDDAPGPEAYLAVFGVNEVGEAITMADGAYDEGGLAALETLAQDRLDVDLVVVERAP